MHFLAFAMKRAHLRCVEMLKPVAAIYGLTPARFDLLHVVLQRHGSCAQSTIRHVLGVSATTISRMVQALEKLGFLKRMRHLRDRRTKFVWLTEMGILTVREMIEGLVRSGHMELAFEGCFAWPAPQAERTVRILFKALRHLARKMADRSEHLSIGEPPIDHHPPWLELSDWCAASVAIGL